MTTHSIATKAVKVFHADGEAAADAYLRSSFSQGNWRTGSLATKARNTVSAFANYKAMARGDNRPTVVGDSRASVAVGAHSVAAACNIVLIGSTGMSGRLCLWGVQKRKFSIDELGLIACPTVLALDEEFGPDRVVDLEIWMLRSGDAVQVSAQNARLHLPEFIDLIDRLTQ
ncbi:MULTISPECIES: hypothetical protein [unclassified Rhodococcus (in: high G+C Gram-positive bacteria)]|uniref:hypothetical protein n=1 Tax=unclassified Rhodococcus (in: high G+C Gram-positive bacteria) TaxID=192944 RepID=UPI0007BAE1A6|nr:MULTISPECIES: hypothetical protein [unclassified Rhodococcus (in: high G+C Gram-positive bacteria)]KZE98928.1 hypothetical protein A2J02_12485 [Rhodococcus sp. EPR-147]KZE98970.1 hypothetical protein A2J04_15165 [Rhodococcus sp. EPR-279]